MSQALTELQEWAESSSRIETAELMGDNNNHLHLIGRDSDMPFGFWQKLNNSEDLGIYNTYGITENEIPKVEHVVIDWEME